MTRLRPEQVAGAIDPGGVARDASARHPPGSSARSRTPRTTTSSAATATPARTSSTPRGGTIPQRLLLMNGELVQEKTKDGFFNASSQIAALAPDDRTGRRARLSGVLTRGRRPKNGPLHGSPQGTKEEHAQSVMTDLFWTLLNSTEFSWNH